MASPITQEATYDSPQDFFDAMNDYPEHDQDMLNYDNASQFANPFKPTSKMNQAIDPMLSNNPMNGFNLDSNFWNDPSQFGPVLETINPTLSPLGGDQSVDTGYVSQEGSSSKSPPNMGPPSNGHSNSKQANSAPKPRKRSSTKSVSTTKSTDGKPARKARRTSKAASIVEPLGEEDDEKREQFLARNREAASKCRQKKKEWTQDLEQRARDLSSQKQMLTTYLAMLKNELLMLKCKCLEHSDCGCEEIRSYMKNTLNTMPPANAALYSKLEQKNAGDIESEVARKQSSANMFDMENMGSPDGMVTSPSSTGGDVGSDLLQFEAELQAAVKD